MHSRRSFLRTTLAGTAALAASDPLNAAAELARRAARGRAPLDLLVLGGTGFIGPHLVRYAVARGHRVTIFTRGRRQADLPGGVIRLVGDRNGQLGALEGKRWDAVIDDSATNPDWVRQSTELLRDAVGRYMFTSSTGVYYPYLRRGLEESDPVRVDADDPNDGSAAFGTRKALCERQVRQVFGDRAIISRPTYIVGPGDTTDRFPYWPVRLARGGEVLAPGRPDDPVQFIDVRDLAEWMVRALEDQRSGIFNLAGPRETLVMPAFLDEARTALSADVQYVWVDDYDFLASHGIESAVPWIMLRGNDAGHTSIRNARAVDAGLTFRPIAATVRDTLAWWPSVPEARRANPRFAFTPEKEAEMLAAWKVRTR